MSQRTLLGKTALVTGSTSGIGLGVAKSLALQGANLILNGFGDTEQPCAEIRALGVEVRYHGADMSKVSDIEAMMGFAQESFGIVDILVNNAGIQHVASVEDFPVDRWDAIIAINLSSAFHTSRLALPLMKKKQLGTHHQHSICAWPGWLSTKIGLCCSQAWHRGFNQSHSS